jgi:hypothetical protein
MKIKKVKELKKCPPITWIHVKHIEESERIEEMSTNYVDTCETYSRKTTIIDIYFAEKIVKIIDLDPKPKSIVECKQCYD